METAGKGSIFEEHTHRLTMFHIKFIFVVGGGPYPKRKNGQIIKSISSYILKLLRQRGILERLLQSGAIITTLPGLHRITLLRTSLSSDVTDRQPRTYQNKNARFGSTMHLWCFAFLHLFHQVMGSTWMENVCHRVTEAIKLVATRAPKSCRTCEVKGPFIQTKIHWGPS